MSSAGNPYVNLSLMPGEQGGMPTGAMAPLPYPLQLAQIQRQQRLADLLRQQAGEDIPVQTGGGQPAPISWGSVLAKALSGVGAGLGEKRALDQQKQLGDQDQQAAQALVKALTQGAQQPGAPAVAPITTPVDPTTPQLPGQAAPPQQAPVPVQVGGAPATSPTTAAPTMQDQLAAVLAAHGGPQTQMIQQAMLPQIMNRQNLDYEHQLNWEDVLKKNALPMSEATKEQSALNVYTPIPQGDPAYAGMRPGTILGRNSMGAIKPLQESDMKSQGAMNQEIQLVRAKEAADIAKQQALYGIGPNGVQADFSKPLSNSAFEAVAQSVANYDRSEATALSRYPAPVRAQIQARVSAINPSYQQTNYNEANATKLAFAKGPQGQSLQSLNSTISHMDLMKQYVTALNNGDVQTINALKNAVATEFGGTAPTNAQAAAEILGPEMAKAVLPNGGTGPEREGFINTLKQKASQGQLVGVLNTYQGLMAGQLLSLKKRYENIPGQPKDFESKFLLPETQQILASRPEYRGGVTGGASPPPVGKKVVRTGTLNGKKVVQYSDGTTDYAP